MEYRTYSVSRRDKEPLLAFIVDALEGQGCQILKATDPDIAPFRITFELPSGERMGIVCYAFFANRVVTKARPLDEHRLQIKYGSEGGKHRIWQDPYCLYTTLFLGINPKERFFVGVDPEVHNPTRFFISLEFKDAHAEEILGKGWYAWERSKRDKGRKRPTHPSLDTEFLDPSREPVEVVVGGRPERFLDYIRFERLAYGLDQGNRHLIADKVAAGQIFGAKATDLVAFHQPPAVHELSLEFQMTEAEVLDLIASARRLKMAVRGWVAEEQLVRVLQKVDGVSDCVRLDEEGGPDVRLRFEESDPLTIQCKNVLRQRMADGTIKLDFQKTRGSKNDPCTRFYRPQEFDLVAACLHSVTERWEFRYALPATLDPHAKCKGRLSQGVRLDTRWKDDARAMLQAASGA